MKCMPVFLAMISIPLPLEWSIHYFPRSCSCPQEVRAAEGPVTFNWATPVLPADAPTRPSGKSPTMSVMCAESTPLSLASNLRAPISLTLPSADSIPTRNSRMAPSAVPIVFRISRVLPWGSTIAFFRSEFTRTHLTDLAFGGFDPDAQQQNGTFRGTYSFSDLPSFALGIYDSFFQI